jgi:hypothetical protein
VTRFLPLLLTPGPYAVPRASIFFLLDPRGTASIADRGSRALPNKSPRGTTSTWPKATKVSAISFRNALARKSLAFSYSVLLSTMSSPSLLYCESGHWDACLERRPILKIVWERKWLCKDLSRGECCCLIRPCKIDFIYIDTCFSISGQHTENLPDD